MYKRILFPTDGSDITAKPCKRRCRSPSFAAQNCMRWP